MSFCLTKLKSSEHSGFQSSGWFEKEGRFFRVKTKRFLRLQGPFLSNHTSEDDPAIWCVNLRETPVTARRQDNGKNLLIIELHRGTESFVAEDEDVFEKGFKIMLPRAADNALADFYEVDRMIGEGAFARVYLARGKQTGTEYAVKIIDKVPEELSFILAEVKIAQTVSHPFIVRTYDIFEHTDQLDIVMELMRGGELFDQIANAGRFSEKDASFVMRKIVEGISYLHLHNIVHRDLKPENVLCKDSNWPLQVKLCDFGLAGSIEESPSFDDGEMIGTPGYVAPEVVMRKPYGAAVDMWAAGVILYIMLSGKMPFYGKTDGECLRRIAMAKYAFPPKQWDNVSDQAQSLVRSLLQQNPDKRLTATAALNHPWLAAPEKQDDTPIDNDLSDLHSSRRKFRKAVNAVITITKLSNLSRE